MALLDRFKRKKTQSVLPSEVDDYYKSEMKSRRSTSVMMALFALVITLVVAGGLFFGGRAVYRFANRDKDNKTTQTTANTQNGSAKEDAAKSDQGSDSGTGSFSNDQASGGSAESTNSTSSTTNKKATTTNPSTVPATGDTPESLPATGDEGQ